MYIHINVHEAFFSLSPRPIAHRKLTIFMQNHTKKAASTNFTSTQMQRKHLVVRCEAARIDAGEIYAPETCRC